MAHFVSESKGGDFERPPVGMQPAVASKIYDLGYQPGYKGGKPKRKYVVLFELSPRYTKGDLVGQHMAVTREYSASFGTAEKPTDLRRDLVSWRTRQFTKEELAKFDLDAILNHPCTLSLVADKTEDGKDWINISAILPPMKGVEKVTVEYPADYIPAWVQKKVNAQLPDPEAESTFDVGSDAPPSAGSSDDDIPF